MAKLLFIKNIEELNYIERHFGNLLSTHKIITNSSLPFLRLQAKGVAAEQVSDYLSAEEFHNILKQARIFSREWFRPFESLLDYKGINLGELIRLDQIWFFRELICSYLALERIIEINRPEEAAFFTNLDFPNLGAFKFNGSSDIFTAAAIWKCGISRVYVHRLKLRRNFKRGALNCWRRAKRIIARNLPYALFYCRSLKRLAQNLACPYNPSRILLSKFRKDARKKMAVAFGNGLELLILKQVMETLSELKDFDVVFLNMESSFNVSHLGGRSGLDVDGKLKFISLEDFMPSLFPRDRKIIQSVHKARRIFASGSPGRDSPLPSGFYGLLKSAHLAVQFDFVWGDYFFEAVSMVDKLSRVYRVLNPDVVLVANAVGYAQRAFVKLAKQFRAKSITVPHGWVGDIDYYDFASDLFLAWGELSRKQLIKEFDKAACEIAVVGARQFEGIVPSGSSDTAGNIKRRLGFRQGCPLVAIITSGLPQSAFLALNGRRFFELWESIKSFVREHAEIDFVVRAHPYCEAIDWFRQMVDDFNQPNLKVIEGEKLESFLPAVDAGMLIGEGTTAGYLFILFGVPIILFKRFLRSDVFITVEDWSRDNGLLVAEQENELFNLTIQLLNDSGFRKETIDKEQRFLDNSLLIRDGNVGERIKKAVAGLYK